MTQQKPIKADVIKVKSRTLKQRTRHEVWTREADESTGWAFMDSFKTRHDAVDAYKDFDGDFCIIKMIFPV